MQFKLFGVTGPGKTFTMANVIAALNKPTLIIWSKKFVICDSLSTALSLHFSYRHPLSFGRLLTKMTDKAEQGV